MTAHNTEMQFNKNFGILYLQDTPLALAIERTIECDLLAQYKFHRPLLDVGCGEGIFAKKLFDSKIDVGIDPNAREINRAREYGQYLELITCKGDAIPKPDASFATIFSNSVLEHILELDPVLTEMHRLLKDHGIVYLTLPTDKFEQFSWGYTVLSCLGLAHLAKQYANKFNKFWRHYHCYNKNNWSQLFEKNGFTVEKCIEYNPRFTCMLNNMLTPIAFFSFIVKKILNRWFLFEKLRYKVSPLLYKIFAPCMHYTPVSQGRGGLIFFILKKANN